MLFKITQTILTDKHLLLSTHREFKAKYINCLIKSIHIIDCRLTIVILLMNDLTELLSMSRK